MSNTTFTYRIQKRSGILLLNEDFLRRAKALVECIRTAPRYKDDRRIFIAYKTLSSHPNEALGLDGVLPLETELLPDDMDGCPQLIIDVERHTIELEFYYCDFSIENASDDMIFTLIANATHSNIRLYNSSCEDL